MIIYTFVSFWSRYLIPVGNEYCVIFVENHILIMNLYFHILLVKWYTSPITSTNNFNRNNFIFSKPNKEQREVSAMEICHNHDSPSPKTPPGYPKSQAYI